MLKAEQAAHSQFGTVPVSDASDCRDPINELFALRRSDHKARVEEVETALRREYPRAPADERFLLQMAAHDVSLGGTLADIEAELAARLLTLVDSPTTFALVARGLRIADRLSTDCAKSQRDARSGAGWSDFAS